MIKHSIFLLLLFGGYFVPPALSAATETALTDNFKSGLDKWAAPSNRYMEIIDGQLTNKTVYASGIALKEKNIGNFTLSFRLKFLKNTEILPGHFSIGIGRGYGTWMLYFTANANHSQITSKFTPQGDDKKATAF
jgi:hypothetical protein